MADFDMPQVRRTQTVLGLQAHSSPGYRVGLNASRVAVGCLPLELRLRESPQGLTGPALVRLVLERSRSARQAVDILVGLIDRFGQGGLTDCVRALAAPGPVQSGLAAIRAVAFPEADNRPPLAKHSGPPCIRANCEPAGRG